ncbi:MAG: hypothetical protein ACXWPJ_05480 [Candidatus Limnocylindrales bacterium]
MTSQDPQVDSHPATPLTPERPGRRLGPAAAAVALAVLPGFEQLVPGAWNRKAPRG